MYIQEIILEQIEECKRLEEYNYNVGIILPSRDELKKIMNTECLYPISQIVEEVKFWYNEEEGLYPISQIVEGLGFCYHKDEITITTYKGNQITISSMDIMNETLCNSFSKIFASNNISKTDINHLGCFIHGLYTKEFNYDRAEYLPTPIEILPIKI